VTQFTLALFFEKKAPDEPGLYQTSAQFVMNQTKINLIGMQPEDA